MAQAHLKVVGIMGRRHLHRAGTEADLAVFVAHDGDLTIHQRQNALLAYEVLELLVLRVDGHAGIAQHGFGTGGGDDDIAAAIAEGIADIPQMAGLFGVLHLGVGQGGQAMGAPVDDAASLIDQALLIQFAESLTDGAGTALVHGETIAAPITGSAHLLLLLHDAAAVFFLPRPDALQELLTAQIMAGQTLCVAQILFHLDLSGNAGVVAAGQPQRLIALHPFVADQDILQRAVHGMAHVELSGNIGGRHNDGKRLLVRIGIGVEAVVVHPHLIDTGLHLPRIIHFR